MNTEAMSTEHETLRLADALDAEFVQGRISNYNGRKAASELRRLHEVNRDLLKALHEALETEQKPVISTDHGPWIPSTHPGEEGETYCKRCLLRDKFFGSRQCDPHIVFRDPPQRKPLTDEEIDALSQARPLTDELMDCVDRLGSEADTVDPRVWQHLLVYAPKPEEEPVAWMHNFIEGNVITHKPADIGRHPERWTPLYTAPPKREWVGLTDQEIHEIDGYEEDRKMYRFARYIEAKLKERNK